MLTSRQEQVLNLIKETINNSGYPPTRAEIAEHMGFKSVNAAEDHLKALVKKGVIKLVPGASRGIIIQGKYNSGEIPLIGKVAAGSPIMADENITNFYKIDNRVFGTQPDYLMLVNGNSMQDCNILDGDLVAIKSNVTPKNKDIVVARIEDEITLKRFMKKEDCIELRPENKDYETITVNPDTNSFHIEGIAVGIIRNNI